MNLVTNQNGRQSRMLGAMWGSLVGDALGVPVEFLDRETVQRNPVTGLRGFGTHHQPPGTWSDDSSLLLCTVESLAACGRYDAADLARRFVRWESENWWTPHGTVFDIGGTTAQALSRLAAGAPPEEAGSADVYSNGNGSLMRIIPLALWLADRAPETLAEYATRGSSLTHRHPRSQMACALYCLLVRELLCSAAPAEALAGARRTFANLLQESLFAAERQHFRRLETGALGDCPERDIRSSGYVIDTLEASIWCLLTSASFEETVLKAVNLGGDTDTTGTVAGGLAGACYGLQAIPAAWRQALARHDDIASLFTHFLSQFPTSS